MVKERDAIPGERFSDQERRAGTVKLVGKRRLAYFSPQAYDAGFEEADEAGKPRKSSAGTGDKLCVGGGRVAVPCENLAAESKERGRGDPRVSAITPPLCDGGGLRIVTHRGVELRHVSVGVQGGGRGGRRARKR